MKTVNWRTKATPVGGGIDPPAKRPGCELHHFAVGPANTDRQLIDLCRSVWRDHVKSRGWADIFYCFVVGRNGSVAVGRGWDRGTSSGLDYVTICLAQDTGKDDVTPAQEAAVRELLAEAKRRGVGAKLRTHGERAKTECPGAGGRRLMDRLRKGTTVPKPKPAPKPKPKPKPAPKPAGRAHWPANVARGARGARVRVVQGLLHARGMGPQVGNIDGIFGSRTDAGVRTVQRAEKIAADGIVGPVTIGKLLEGS